MRNRSRWAELVDELAAFLLSGSCAGCDAPGTLLCGNCLLALAVDPVHMHTPEGMPVVASLSYQGVAARCIRRLKEDGETLLASPLGATLAAVMAESPVDPSHTLMVPIPTGRSAFRRRGYRVPELLMRRAGLPVSRILVQSRRTADQRGLGVVERARNVAGSMRARHARAAQEVLLFDDVVTTGATLDEGARALEQAGFRVRGAIALAATARHDAVKVNDIQKVDDI